MVDGDNVTELEEVFRDLADNGEFNSEKNFLIGLAYFNGIEVERDSEKAVSLIIASAHNGLPDAIHKLAEMYWVGDGVAVNYENSILWRKKLVELYDRQFSETKEYRETLDYVNALESLTLCLYELSAYRESLLYAKRLVSLLEHIRSNHGFAEFFYYYAQAYDFCAKNSKKLGLYDEAIAYCQKYFELSKNRYESTPSTVNLHNLAVAYERMGDVYYAIGNMSQGEKLYCKALKINDEIDKELQSVDSAYSLSSSYLTLGDIYIKNCDYEKADRYYAQAVELRKRILNADNSDARRKEYGEAMLAWGTSSMLLSEFKKAKQLFDETKSIMEELVRNRGTIENQHAYSVALNRCAKICETENALDKALLYYSDSLDRRRKIISRIETAETVFEYALTLYFIAGIYQKLYDITNAGEAYEKVVKLIFPILSKDHRGDWHRILAESAFELFKFDTFSGEQYLQYAIDAWKWLVTSQPENKQFQKQYEVCRKIYRTCYPK